MKAIAYLKNLKLCVLKWDDGVMKAIAHSNWQNLRSRILSNAQAIQQRRNNQPFELEIDQIIHQMREERDQQLSEDLFPSKEQL
ncbi:hypothetical protein FD725_23950 [Nostoc sp. TCL26-01]|nr:hypothetical protein FD725_23950 [Nostoc sp. TCL26-01]